MYDEELRVIPFKEGDTIKFQSNDVIHKFTCSFREHYYNKGQPTYISHNECEGKRLRSRCIESCIKNRSNSILLSKW